MYDTHQPIIRNYALRSPKHTLHVISFVLASIQQKFYRVAGINEDIRKTGTTYHFSKYQAKAWEHICEHALEIHQFVQRHNVTAAAAIDFYSNLPGLGLAKAGFCAQLLHGVGGCLDRHWLKELGLSPKIFNASGVTPNRRAHMIRLYESTLNSVGTCEHLWNAWCHTVASLYPDKFIDAEDVSVYHINAITGECV